MGNITAWAKYRFFRKVKTYGDRQAAVRFGLELPTGKKDAPNQTQVNVPAFVRQQLTPISGGLSPHFDIAFSQAGGRFIFGGNAEGILRSERDGFRMGHEVRVNTDTEYVLLPRKYDAPGHELFVILETTLIHRATSRLTGTPVSGSKSTEYYVAPGLQYAAAPQFVIEGSIQLPVVRNTGPLILRTDRNLLLGVRYLFEPTDHQKNNRHHVISAGRASRCFGPNSATSTGAALKGSERAPLSAWPTIKAKSCS